MRKLSATMWLALNYLRAQGHGIAYANEWDPTYNALKRRGLVTYSRALKYGKSCWRLTEEGKKYDLSK